MKIKLLKDHPEGKAGETIEVSEARAAYFERMGLVDTEQVKEKISNIKITKK